jgi:membrane protein implicated in regulation of membrane protease activity
MISIYLIVAIVCALLLIIMAAFSDFGDFDTDVDVDLGADMDVDGGVDLGGHGDFHGGDISPLSIPVILVFGTVFGATGSIFEDILENQLLVPVYATILGLAVTAVVFVILVKVFIKTQAHTQVDLAELVGSECETTMPISSDSPGQIMVITDERGRTLLTATSNVNIPTNTVVKITGIVGNGVRVIPKSGGENNE